MHDRIDIHINIFFIAIAFSVTGLIIYQIQNMKSFLKGKKYI
jgi:hypothetical protein